VLYRALFMCLFSLNRMCRYWFALLLSFFSYRTTLWPSEPGSSWQTDCFSANRWYESTENCLYLAVGSACRCSSATI